MLCVLSCCEKLYDQKQLTEKRVYLTYELRSSEKGSQSRNSAQEPRGKLKERPWISVACSACFLCNPGLLTLGCTRLGPRTPIINQENVPDISPQHSLMEAFPIHKGTFSAGQSQLASG